jgi:hypothetical protein
MKKASFLITTIFFYCFINQSCSQTSNTPNKSTTKTFQATTPCTEEIKQMLGISDPGCEMMKWTLSLSRDDRELPSTFDLSYTYGVGKPGTRGFKEGAKTNSLNGKWTVKKNKTAGITADVITLLPANSPLSLSFLQPEEGLLHLLNKDQLPLVGTAAWSFTLNNIDASAPAKGSFVAKELLSAQINSDTDTVGKFVGRTPCNEALRKLNNIGAAGCQIIKCQVILLQDTKTHTPTNCVIQTIYVGNGDDNKYSVTGKWKIMQGTPADPSAIVYQLQPDKMPAGNEILLLKASDSVLFFIDKDSHLLIGNDYSSYTLSRTK